MSIPSSGSSTARSASMTSSRVGIRRSRVSRETVLLELVPGRARVDERVVLRPDLGISVQRAQPDRDLLALGPEAAEEARAANRAEDLPRGSALGVEDAQELLAGQKPELLAWHAALREPERPRMLPAKRAVTVVRSPEGQLDLEAHAATEAASADPSRLARRGAFALHQTRCVGRPHRQSRHGL